MDWTDDQPPRTLGAILLNPPLTTGAATMRHLRVAAEVLGCNNVQVGNLFAVPTISVTDINDVGRDVAGWESARWNLDQVVASSAELVAGWGVSGLHGRALAHRQAQVTWLIERLRALKVPGVWTLNGQARHPSRWHQYVSDRHRRAIGVSTFPQRLAAVLQRVDLNSAPFDGAVVRTVSGAAMYGRLVTSE